MNEQDTIYEIYVELRMVFEIAHDIDTFTACHHSLIGMFGVQDGLYCVTDIRTGTRYAYPIHNILRIRFQPVDDNQDDKIVD